MKKLLKMFVIMATVLVSIGMVAQNASAEKSIGVIVWDDDKLYTDAKQAIIEQLNAAGFGEPKSKFTIEVASGNKARAAQIAQKFATAKMDMIVSLGTSATVAVLKETRDVPVVFSMVYDPIDSKIAEDWKSSGNNATGTSNKVMMSVLLENLRQLAPVKNLAVLYTPGEKNSEAQLKDMQAAGAQAGMKIIPVPLTSKEEATPLVTDVAGKVEAIFLSGSSIVGDALPAVVEIASKAKVITVTHQAEKVEKGVLLGVSANSFLLGRLAGDKAVKILKGAKPSSIPIEPQKKPDVIVNMKTAKAGQITVPPAFLKSATRVIE